MKTIIHVTICTLLFGFGHRVIADAIHDAALDGNLPAIKNILAAQPDAVNARDEKGLQPLHLAVIKGHDDVVRVLLDSGADIEAKNADGYTSLQLSAIMGKKETAKLLLERKAKIDAQDNDQMPALHWAVGYDNKEIVELLLANHANVNAVNKLGNTP